MGARAAAVRVQIALRRCHVFEARLWSKNRPLRPRGRGDHSLAQNDENVDHCVQTALTIDTVKPTVAMRFAA